MICRLIDIYVAWSGGGGFGNAYTLLTRRPEAGSSLSSFVSSDVYNTLNEADWANKTTCWCCSDHFSLLWFQNCITLDHVFRSLYFTLFSLVFRSQYYQQNCSVFLWTQSSSDACHWHLRLIILNRWMRFEKQSTWQDRIENFKRLECCRDKRETSAP
jgi:hypothetical protein